MRLLLTLLIPALLVGCSPGTEPVAEKTTTNDGPFAQQINELIGNMSIEEKVGQMTQLNLDVISVGELYKLDEPHTLDEAKLKKAIVDYKVGSILNCGGHTYTREHWNQIIGQIQNMATNETPNKVPVLYGIDAIHGVNYTVGATLFPQPLGQAATWNPSLVEQGAAITAYECRASGIPWNFSPVLDLMRQPMWSRCFETYGEDVHLAKAMTKACIYGYEGDDIAHPEKVASCMKHFLGYSWSFSGKDRTPVYMHERQLREYFLPTFQTAIATGAHTVMINSGEINGIPVHASYDILTTLLRDELGFEGLAVTDWEDIMKLNNIHMTAPTMKEAVRQSVMAGIDMSMVPNDYEFSDLLIELVKEGTVPESRLDESVERILKVKFQLGLFDNPVAANADGYAKFGSEEHAQAAFNTAAESITLLKNENNVLPLAADGVVLVTGPAAKSLNILNGAWTHTWQGVEEQYNTANKNTIADAMIAERGAENIHYTEGASLDALTDVDAAVAAAKKASAIVVCLGELPSTEKPGDIDDLSMPAAQLELVEALAATGKPITLVLVENRPRLVNRVEPLCDAIVMAYEPGDEGGNAIAAVLTGKVNPSGKLPFTYPRHPASLLMYDHKHTETLDQQFGRNAFNPQWEFAHGLSYTTFEYSDLTLSTDKLSGSNNLTVSVTVTNTGNRTGKEVVPCFISDDFASITPSVKRLRAFTKIELEAGAAQTVTFEIAPTELAFVNAELDWVTEDGDFTVRVGGMEKPFNYTEKPAPEQ